ncbi:MAG: general secretion pathway protein GspB, partial [Aeromonadaceae bacterium]
RYSSHVYSSTAANRIITLNGHDYHEGEEVAPGVRLLQIQADYSIFRVGGQSFSLPSLTDWSGVP